MTAARAIEAAQERLRAIVDDEPRLSGEFTEAMDAARAVPSELVGALHKLAATDALQRRWDVLVRRAEAGSDDGQAALLTALLAVGEEFAALVAELLSARELRCRARVEALGVERRTLEWIVSESSRDTIPPPAEGE